MEETGTYKTYLLCSNCLYMALYELEKGVRVHSTECANCGVKALKPFVDGRRKDPRFIDGDDDEELS